MAAVKMAESVTHKELFLDTDEIALVRMHKPDTGTCPQRAEILLKSKADPIEICIGDREAFEQLVRPSAIVAPCEQA